MKLEKKYIYFLNIYQPTNSYPDFQISKLGEFEYLGDMGILCYNPQEAIICNLDTVDESKKL